MVGSLYAVIALGYTLVYGVLQLINFAHSEVFMLGAFSGLFAARALVPATVRRPPGWPRSVWSPSASASGRSPGRPPPSPSNAPPTGRCAGAGRPELAYLISAIGASLFAVNLAGKEFGRQAVPVPELFTNGTGLHGLRRRGLHPDAGHLRDAAAMLVVLDRLVAGTRLGQGDPRRRPGRRRREPDGRQRRAG